uniref:Putative secreted protein n=1 Tax=Anopheles marajoara TaxID=58244 RepID=A0A2M4C5X7_9DIPT
MMGCYCGAWSLKWERFILCSTVSVCSLITTVPAEEGLVQVEVPPEIALWQAQRTRVVGAQVLAALANQQEAAMSRLTLRTRDTCIGPRVPVLARARHNNPGTWNKHCFGRKAKKSTLLCFCRCCLATSIPAISIPPAWATMSSSTIAIAANRCPSCHRFSWICCSKAALFLPLVTTYEMIPCLT